MGMKYDWAGSIIRKYEKKTEYEIPETMNG